MFTPFRDDGVKCLANFALSYGKRYNLGAKVRKLVGLRVKFYHFLYVTPQI